jgi:hypothetical protein
MPKPLGAVGNAADLADLLALLACDSLPMCRALPLLPFHLIFFLLLAVIVVLRR